MKADELKQRLAAVDLFEGLPKRVIAKIASSGRETHHDDGHEVIVEGSGAVGFHLITAGKARVTSGGSIRRTLGVGDCFGEISVLDGKPRSASVEADGPLSTYLVPPSVVQELMDSHPQLARRLVVLLCSRLREAEQRTA
jgi:CRP/FNR family cyclic AMP-dependent transcriptional regulator